MDADSRWTYLRFPVLRSQAPARITPRVLRYPPPAAADVVMMTGSATR